MIAALWNYIQSIPQYKDKTTLMTRLATMGGGRGQIKSHRTPSHGHFCKGFKAIFSLSLAMGPDMPALGEVGTWDTQLYQGQIAATIAQFLGLHYVAEHPVMPVIQTMFPK